MNVIPGHEDMKPKKIVGINVDGTALIDGGDAGILKYQMFVSPGGSISAKPIEKAKIDQQTQRERPTLADRMRGIDQLQPR